VAGFKGVVAKFVAANIKTPIVNIFLAYNIRSIAKDLDFSVIK
jgi:hypothetical protein